MQPRPSPVPAANPLLTRATLTHSRPLYDATMCSRGAADSKYSLLVDPQQICLTVDALEDSAQAVPLEYRISSDQGQTAPFRLVETAQPVIVNECALDRQRRTVIWSRTFQGCTPNRDVVTPRSHEIVLLQLERSSEEYLADWTLSSSLR